MDGVSGFFAMSHPSFPGRVLTSVAACWLLCVLSWRQVKSPTPAFTYLKQTNKQVLQLRLHLHSPTNPHSRSPSVLQGERVFQCVLSALLSKCEKSQPATTGFSKWLASRSLVDILLIDWLTDWLYFHHAFSQQFGCLKVAYIKWNTTQSYKNTLKPEN